MPATLAACHPATRARRRAAALAAVLGAAVILVAAAPPAHADREVDPLSEDAVLYSCGKAKGELNVNFHPEVGLEDLVTWAMGFSCKKFLYASSLATARSGKVTMLTPGSLSPAEAWSLFQAALHGMGLSVVAKGKVLEIVESARAKEEALAIRKSFPDGGGDVVRLLLRPAHVAVDDLRAALELVKSQHGAVSALGGLGAILITDDAAHVARMRTLVTELDRPGDAEALYAIPLAHVDATAVVTTVEQLLGTGAAAAGKGGAAGAGAAPAMRLIADARTNALFLAGSAGDYVRVKALTDALDVDTGAAAQLQLIRLAHARPAEVAATLQGLLGGGATTAGGAARGGGGGGGDRLTPTGEVRVAADEASSSLLVLASARDAAALRALVAEMDRPRRQVYIEALVLEVEAGGTRQLGASWHLGSQDGDGNTWIGGMQSDGLSTVVPADSLNAGGVVGGVLGSALSGSTELFGTSIPSLGLLIQAQTHTSRLDVLASPHLLTLDNQAAKISVGSNIPYKSSSGGTTTTGAVLSPNIERQKIALSLEITPHVAPAADAEDGDGGRDDSVRLEIKLDSSQLGTENFGDDLGPTWKERSLETSVVLHDQESVVLGGLVDERVEDTVTGIPLLGDLPVVGFLFRSTKKVRQKSNLLIVLTPYLVDDSIEGRDILARRMRERDEFLRAADDLSRRVREPHVDYRKKRGLIADIDAKVEQIERERARLDAARTAAPPSGRLDVPPVDAAGDAASP
ncbi:MAG: type II secretion system secretin GspD [Kofleriaceae bacterium]|nr:type II secretion system secretin GspD [Kofleriaceae bacterium]MCB9573340.1 type II secretion system secretin GspD [Kofleriaceae bacterium]